MYGSAVTGREAPALLRGEAVYVADVTPPGTAHMALLGSEYAHAAVRGIDTAAALAMPGVLRVVTAADLEGKLMPLPCVWVPGGAESHFPPHPYGVPGARPVLATDRVRHVGHPPAA